MSSTPSSPLIPREKEKQKHSSGQEKPPKQLSVVSDDDVNSIFKTLTGYTLLLILLPIATYFGAKKYILEDIFGFDSNQSFIYWAVIAVISIHVVLAIMVFNAYREGLKPRSIKQD